MAVLSDKSKVRRGALRVLLVGDAEDRRLEVKTALAALGDPPLEIIEAAPGLSHPSKAGPPPDVTMVLFYGATRRPR